MGTNDPDERPTEKASLEIKIIRASSELDLGLQLPGEEGPGLMNACIAFGGPAGTLHAAHVAGLGPNWACGLAAAQLVLAGVLAIRSRQRRHPR